MGTFLLTLSKDLNKILKNELCYDFLITIGEEPDIKTFKVHSAILCARCPYFQVALSNNWIKKENDKFIFTKPNIFPKTFNVILIHLYGGIIDLNEQESSNLILLLEASDELCLSELCEHIQDFIITKRLVWLRENFLSLAKIVYQHLTFDRLQKLFTEMIYENPKDLFKLETLSELPEDIILFLISRDDFFIKEVQIWEQIIKWGILKYPHLDPDIKNWTIKDFETLKNRLRKSIPLIRFYQMSSKEFKEKVVPFKKILPENLYNNISKFHSRWVKFSFRSSARVKPIDSLIINYKDAAVLASWIDGKNKVNDRSVMYEFYNNPYNFKLLYRGSRDGFSYEMLKKHCYYKGPTIIVAKIEGKQELIGGYNPIYWSASKLACFSQTKKGFIFSTEKGQDNFQEKATVARIKYNYYSQHTTYTYKGYPYLSFGYNNLSFIERECQVRWSYGYYFTPKIKDQGNYPLDELEVFALIPKSRFKYWKINLLFYSVYIYDMRFYEMCLILFGKLIFLIFIIIIIVGLIINFLESYN